MKSAVIGLAALIAAGTCHTCLADDLSVSEQFSDTTIEFKVGASYGNLTLTVAGPNGFYASANARSGSPLLDLRRFGDFDDGQYSYHLTATTDQKIKMRTPLDDGRDNGPTLDLLKGVSTSGAFSVSRGLIVKNDASAPTRRDGTK
jgi:hypothetical protein